MRYAHTRNWIDLLKWLCGSILGEYAYAQFLNEAKSAVARGDADSLLPYLATIAEDPINSALLKEEHFESFRKQYKEQIDAGYSPMKLYIANDLHDIEIDQHIETELLRKCNSKLAGIITTNYDFLCESLFPDFDVYVGEQELLVKDPSYSAEIFKIHGSASQPNTMVLTQTDYSKLMDKQQYLAAKLLTIFIEYPIIFLGYSLQDSDINSILASIARCLGSSGLNRISKRIVFVSYGLPQGDAIGSIMKMFGTDTLEMTQIVTRDFSPIFEAVSEMDRLYDPKLVRQLRKSIVSIASHIDPSSEIVTSGFSQLGNLNDNDRVVIGFSALNEGFGKMPTAEDLYYDVLFDDREFNVERVVSDYLPRLLRSNPGGLPIFKYIAKSKQTTFDDRVQNEIEKRFQISDYLNPTFMRSREVWRKQLISFDIRGLIGLYGHNKAHEKIGILNHNEISVEELGNHLSELVARNGGLEFIKGNSELKRAIRIFDLLKYRDKVHDNEKPLHLSPKCEHPAISEEVDHDV